MTPIPTVFANSPDRGRGLARDMRMRWALEETTYQRAFAAQKAVFEAAQ